MRTCSRPPRMTQHALRTVPRTVAPNKKSRPTLTHRTARDRPEEYQSTVRLTSQCSASNGIVGARRKKGPNQRRSEPNPPVSTALTCPKALHQLPVWAAVYRGCLYVPWFERIADRHGSRSVCRPQSCRAQARQLDQPCGLKSGP